MDFLSTKHFRPGEHTLPGLSHTPTDSLGGDPIRRGPEPMGLGRGLAPPSEPTPSKDTMAVPIRILAQVADSEPQPLSEGVVTSEQDCDSEIAQALRELADEIENPT